MNGIKEYLATNWWQLWRQWPFFLWSIWSPQVWTKTLLLTNLGPRGKLLTEQTSFLMQPYAQFARITSRNIASLFSPATISLVSLYKTHTHVHARDTRPFPNRGRRDCSWSAQHQELAAIMYIIHIQLFIANLDGSWEWPWGPSKSRNSVESQKIPISGE